MSKRKLHESLTGAGSVEERRPDGTLYGMAEAERQIRVARQLYEQTQRTKLWEKLSLVQKRPFIDRACQPPHNEA
jgi:hypothetical protein